MAAFTQKAIVMTFMELLDEKAIEKITVKEIVENCGINRNTFYYHFDGIPALVEYIMKTETERVMRADDDFDSWVEGFIAGAQFCKENKRRVYHIYNSTAREEIERYLNQIATRVMTKYVEKASAEKNINPEDKHLILIFYRSALVGTALDWLDSGMKYDYEVAIRRLGMMLEGQLEEALSRATN